MRPELLAPAGGPEALRAAVQNGADAVYLGCEDFNARRSAKNFTWETLGEAAAYCHVRGVKVYLTLNTLLFDRELPAAAEALRRAAEAGVDAVLVQDLGVLRLARAVAPDLPLHASTQMSIHNTDGALAAKKLGLSRVVLAREMTRDEIAAVAALDGIETEVFVHGAHCMSYSGQCAMSALIGARSGNRGRCAQPCRLPCALPGRANPYPLSLKDLCLADHIPELCALGVTSLKLEGRMKRPEYVAVVTRIYAALLRQRRRPTEEERAALADAFSRDGFTDGYWTGRTGPQMFGARPENAPEPKALFAAARESYTQRELPRVDVEMDLTVRRGEKSRLAVLDFSGNRAVAEGSVPEEARSRPLTEEDLAGRLRKTGGTPFCVGRVGVTLAEGRALSAAAVNALRRDALEQLEALRAAPPRRHLRALAPPERKAGPEAPPRFTVSVEDPRQLSEELLALSPARVYFPIEKLAMLDTHLCENTELCAVLPRVCKEGEREKLRAMLRHCRGAGIAAAAVSNLGHLTLAADAGMALYGDCGLNAANSEALRALGDLGLQSAAVSFELRREQIRDLDKVLPLEAVVYGRLPLMLTENCLIRDDALQCHCSEGGTALRDRTGAEFPVLPLFGCRSEVENSRPLFLADKAEDFSHLGLSFARLRFTTERAALCARVLERYLGRGSWAPREFTRGLFYRSVE